MRFYAQYDMSPYRRRRWPCTEWEELLKPKISEPFLHVDTNLSVFLFLANGLMGRHAAHNHECPSVDLMSFFPLPWVPGGRVENLAGSRRLEAKRKTNVTNCDAPSQGVGAF